MKDFIISWATLNLIFIGLFTMIRERMPSMFEVLVVAFGYTIWYSVLVASCNDNNG